MIQILEKFFEQKDAVILPGLGAITKTEGNPAYYSINQFIHYDDGILKKYLVVSEGLDLEQGEAKIKEFSDLVKSALETAGSYPMGKIGTLKKENNGRLVFIYPEKAKTADTKTPPIKKEEVKTEPLKESPNPQIKNKKKVESKSTETANTEAVEENPENTKNKKGLVLALLFVAIISGGAISTFYFLPEIKTYLSQTDVKEPEKAPVQEVVEKPELASIPTDTIPEETLDTPVVEEEIEEVSENKHFIVAGFFEIESNADRFVETLKDRGFNSEKIPYKHYYIVSFEGFPEAKAAQEKLVNIKKSEEAHAWIFTKE